MKVQDILLKHMVQHLLELCKQELELDQFPGIQFTEEPTTRSGNSFGEFDGDIVVVTKNRHPMDVMRTLAHELVHWKQRVANKELDGSDGSDTENEANAVAGIIMRRFGQMYPDYFLGTLPQ